MKKDIQRFAGLYTHPNPLSEVPEGSLTMAINCSIDREGIIENRRGFDFFGSNIYGAAIDKLLDYKNRALIHHGSTLSYDSNGLGNFTDYSGTYDNVASGVKIKSQEQNGSLFFTSADGIQKIETLSSTPRKAGIPPALDTKLSFGTSIEGFMPYNTRIAYRVVWTRTDANEVFTQGAPSSRAEIANIPATVTSLTRSGSTVTVTTIGPHGYSTGDIIDIEGSEAFTTLTSLTQAAGVATGTVGAAADNPAPGDIVTIRGAAQPEYNGDFTVIANPSATTFTYGIDADASTISPATGDIQAGTFTDGYNGLYVITVSSSTVFTYTINDTPVTTASAIEGQSIIAGKAQDVTLTFPVPSDIDTSFTYRVYRSGVTASPDISPDDRMYLVAENPYVSGSTITITDITPIDLEGEELYTNDTQEGISQSNYRPPLSKDITLYKTFMFYGNTNREQFIDNQLLSVDGITRDTDTITIGSEVYTFSSAENVGAKKFRLFADQSGSSLSRTGSVATITTAQDHGLSPGDRVFISGATDPGFNGTYSVVTAPSSLTFTIAVDSSLASSDTVVVSTGSPAQNIAATARSLTYIISAASSNYYGFYTSGADDVPGLIRIIGRELDTPAFTMTSTNPVKSKFGTALPTTSENESVGNRLYYSKNSQPDSVPLLNYFDIGPRDKSILRIVGLRDSLFIIKEEGVYRLAGDDERSFTITLFDSNLRCQAAESVARLTNNIFMFTDQGIIQMGDGGVALVSRPIEKTILPILSFPNFSTLMHGTGYESDRKYILWCQDIDTDTKPVVAYVYNYVTNAWTKWEKPAYSGLVINDNLFLANGYTNTVLKERKDRAREDKKDESVTATITSYSVDVATITYSYSTVPLQAGMYLQQGGETAKILSVTGNVCQLDRPAPFTTGSCTLSLPIMMQFELTPETVGSAGTLKQFREMQFYPEADSFTVAQVYFASDLSTVNESVTFSYPNRQLGWGYFPWGSEPWGDSGRILGTTPLRTYIPKDLQRCRSIVIGFIHNVANENMAILNTSIVFNENKERTTK